MDEFIYWTRQPESALVGSPEHFRRRLHLFCVMTVEEAKHYKYDTRAYPPLTTEEIALVREYLAQKG